MELGRRSIRAFAELYLGHHYSRPWGEHHHDLFFAVDRKSRSKRVVRASPRRFGKTAVVSLAVPLQALAFQQKWFVLMIGEARTTAESNLQSIIAEVETNDLLLEDFPHLKPGVDQKGQLVKWTDNKITFSSGATVVAKGMGASLRGLKEKRMRPDLAILDDPESPETADTFGKRRKHKNWFGGTFMGLGAADWDVYVIGNLIHNDCLIAELLKSKEWDGKVYRAENKPVPPGYPYPLGNTKQDGSALWPEEWPLEALDAYKRQPTVGTLIYSREMMNEPKDDADKKFNVATFTFFDFVKERDLPKYDIVVTFLDPAGGQKPGEVKAGKKDWAAAVTVGRLRDSGKIQVIDVRMTRGLPDKQIDMLLDAYSEFKGRLGAEENIFKNLIKPNIERRGRERGLIPAVQTIHQTQNKITRILSIQPPIEAGTIEFARHLLTTFPEYFEQFDEFPGDHDDGPDATEGAVRMTEKRISYAPVDF